MNPNKVNGHEQTAYADKPLTLQVTSQQYAVMLILDAQMAQLQIAANQIGGYIKDEKAAGIVVEAMNLLGAKKQALMMEWQRAIQVVSAIPDKLIKG